MSTMPTTTSVTRDSTLAEINGFEPTSGVLVFDEFLSPPALLAIRRLAGEMEYTHPPTWLKVWRITDGRPVGGPELRFAIDNKSPSRTLSVPATTHDALKPLLAQLQRVMGSYSTHPWGDRLTLRFFLYAPGTRISWHNDASHESAFSFYIHPLWSPFWGGELMIADTTSAPSPTDIDPLRKGHAKAPLDAHGCGLYIAPKPNRMVLMSSNLWHATNRVDPDAGDNLRVSVVGFFDRDPGKAMEVRSPKL